MKIISMLFMGVFSSGRLPNSWTRGFSVRHEARDGLRIRGDSGFVRLPGVLTLPGAEVAHRIETRYLIAGHRGGRMLLQLRALVKQLFFAASRGAQPALKRWLDIGASGALLLLLSPLFALIALCVKLQDGGPVLFAQTRVGRFGREFKMYKVRSMCLNAEQRLAELLARNQHSDGVTFKLKDDPRITAVGRILRKFSLDELPQLYNVFVGDMSLVGPRPPVPREVAKYTLADRRRLAVTPGITCIWQISGRAEIDFSGQVRLDVEYIEKQTLLLDLRILAGTLPAVISARGAC